MDTNQSCAQAKFGLIILLQTTHQATHNTPSSPLNLFWHRFSGHIWPEPQAHAHSGQTLACFRGRLTSVVGFEPKILVVECRDPPRSITQHPRSTHAALTQHPRSTHAAPTQHPRSTHAASRSITQHSRIITQHPYSIHTASRTTHAAHAIQPHHHTSLLYLLTVSIALPHILLRSFSPKPTLLIHLTVLKQVQVDIKGKTYNGIRNKRIYT